MITVYLFDAQNIYTGTQEVDPYQALPRCTLTSPPQTTGTEVAQWVGTQWVVLPEYPVPPPAPLPSNAEQRAARQSAYQREADPIFFMSQREEATQEEWQAKITEIKERYPYYYDDEGNLLEAQE
jgi:hypothetical protein